MNILQIQSAGLAVFRLVGDETTSEQRVEWLLLQASTRSVISLKFRVKIREFGLSKSLFRRLVNL